MPPGRGVGIRAAVMLVAIPACGRLDFEPIADAMPAGCGHTFCDNFDRSTPVGAPWTAADTSGGTLVLDPSVRVSAPNGLLVDVPFPLTGAVYLTEALPRADISIHVELDLDLEQTDATAEIDLVQVLWVPPPAPCDAFGYFFVRDDTGPLELQETFVNCGAASSNDTFPFGVGNGFHHLALDIQLGALGTAALQVQVDGASVVDKLADRDVPASALELRLGAPGTRTTSVAWRIRYDNVIVDLR